MEQSAEGQHKAHGAAAAGGDSQGTADGSSGVKTALALRLPVVRACLDAQATLQQQQQQEQELQLELEQALKAVCTAYLGPLLAFAQRKRRKARAAPAAAPAAPAGQAAHAPQQGSNNNLVAGEGVSEGVARALHAHGTSVLLAGLRMRGGACAPL